MTEYYDYNVDPIYEEEFSDPEYEPVIDDEFELLYIPLESSPADAAGPGPGCITVITLSVCAALVYFLLHLASGISVTLPAQTLVPDTAALPTVIAEPANPVLDVQYTSSFEASATPCQVSNLFPDKVLRWCSLISYYSNRHTLSPDLVAAVIWLESGGNEVAYSRSGAVGLMQVMPSDGLSASFMCANGPCFSDRPTTAELQDPEFNISYGTRMLARLLQRHGNVREALKSYGPMDVGYYYADKVLGLFEKYRTPTP